MRYEELTIEERNVVLEAFRSGRTIDKLLVPDGCQDDPVCTILREVGKYDTIINYMPRERLDQISETGKHQGVTAYAATYEYAEVKDILRAAEEKGEPPSLILLDGIKDLYNLKATIRTADPAGAHDVIIPKHRVAGLTVIVAKAPVGILSYTPVAKVTNPTATMEDLKEKGMWSVCADMGGELMYKMSLKGSIGFVVGDEGEGVRKLVREHYNAVTSIPMKGDIDSPNVSVVAGMLAYEIVRQHLETQSSQG